MAGLVFEICQKKGLRLIRYDEHKNSTELNDEKKLDELNKELCEQDKELYEPDKKLCGQDKELYEPDKKLCRQDKIIEIEVVPGIPALAAGAALLGAPLTHDFAVVSLSDLLTPWEKIEKRISAAAQADFVIAIYNPKSKKRDWQLSRAKELILEHRRGDTPVGVVTSAMREEQKITVTTLKDMDIADVGMQTILLVGNESSVQYLDFMFTPRGYSGKYDI
ncbi:MAG: precorrin-3B C(17)-methyltransferase [Desulfamplus sp.]|nr:precorrin-3B C(17)-methyltransferase [Desulfamplus sp.]